MPLGIRQAISKLFYLSAAVFVIFAAWEIYVWISGGPRSDREQLVQERLTSALVARHEVIQLSDLLPETTLTRACTLRSYFSKQEFLGALDRNVEWDVAYRWRNNGAFWTLLLVADHGGYVAVRIRKHSIADLDQRAMVACKAMPTFFRVAFPKDPKTPSISLGS